MRAFGLKDRTGPDAAVSCGHVVTSLHDESCESGISNVLCATPDGGGGGGGGRNK